MFGLSFRDVGWSTWFLGALLVVKACFLVSYALVPLGYMVI